MKLLLSFIAIFCVGALCTATTQSTTEADKFCFLIDRAYQKMLPSVKKVEENAHEMYITFYPNASHKHLPVSFYLTRTQADTYYLEYQEGKVLWLRKSGGHWHIQSATWEGKRLEKGSAPLGKGLLPELTCYFNIILWNSDDPTPPDYLYAVMWSPLVIHDK